MLREQYASPMCIGTRKVVHLGKCISFMCFACTAT